MERGYPGNNATPRQETVNEQLNNNGAWTFADSKNLYQNDPNSIGAIARYMDGLLEADTKEDAIGNLDKYLKQQGVTLDEGYSIGFRIEEGKFYPVVKNNNTSMGKDDTWRYILSKDDVQAAITASKKQPANSTEKTNQQKIAAALQQDFGNDKGKLAELGYTAVVENGNVVYKKDGKAVTKDEVQAAITASKQPANNTDKSTQSEQVVGNNASVTVMKGESLNALAQKYGVTVQQLKDLNSSLLRSAVNCNGKTVYFFRVGAQIQIPVTAANQVAINANKEVKADEQKKAYNEEFLSEAHINELIDDDKNYCARDITNQGKAVRLAVVQKLKSIAESERTNHQKALLSDLDY